MSKICVIFIALFLVGLTTPADGFGGRRRTFETAWPSRLGFRSRDLDNFIHSSNIGNLVPRINKPPSRIATSTFKKFEASKMFRFGTSHIPYRG